MLFGLEKVCIMAPMNFEPVDRKARHCGPESEFLPSKTIVKLYYCNRIDEYVTVPGASLFKVAAERCALD